VPDLADPRPPYVQIADDLRRQIRAGRYHPGDRLPSNKAMSETYGSAPETIRRALGVLRDEGLTATQSTRGTFVLRHAAEPGPSPEYLRLTAALDEMAGRLAKVEERLEALENPGSARR
jgi:DNA-binding GntR family transcriptional regulator